MSGEDFHNPYDSFVLAGDHQQYKDYLESQGLDRSNHLYVSRPEDLRGVRAYDLRVVGTFYRKKREPRRMLEMAKRNIVPEEEPADA